MAPSINTCSFKNRLDKYWKDQKLYYEDYRAIIDGSHVRNESSNENEESGEQEPEQGPVPENIIMQGLQLKKN